MADKLKQITSPAGVAFFPKLNTPDTKFKATGEYNVQLILDPENPAHASFIETVKEADEAAFKAALAEAKTPKAKKGLKRQYQPWTEHTDADGEETGNVLVKFKSAASYVDKKTGKTRELRINFFDAKGKPITQVPEIWSGSVLKVNASLAPYNNTSGVGISLRINAVQIIELRGPGAGGGDASAFGFSEEDGYEVGANTQGPLDPSDDFGDEDEDEFDGVEPNGDF